MSVSFYPIRGIHPVGNDLDINVSNGNACDILVALGLSPREQGGELRIDEFINRCRNWLRANIGKPGREIEPSVDAEPGRATFIDCGRREGYLNEKLHALAVMAERGREQGATLISWG